MRLTPEQQRLYQIFHPVAAAQQAVAFSNSRQARFVYYTRAEAAISILKNRHIWMGKSMCMNDYSEVKYGLQRLTEIYLNSETGKNFQSLLDHLFGGIRMEIEQLFNKYRNDLHVDTYIPCVSEHRNEEDTLGRLSMWRAYGGMNGVALVMNSAPFQSTEPSDVVKIYASPVAYLDPQKFAEKFSEVVKNIENAIDFLSNKIARK
jgi:hypothetical protein